MNGTHCLGKLANLNVARTRLRGIAPHKPLMLLTVIDLIETGDIPDGWVRYDVHLVSRFRDYWEQFHRQPLHFHDHARLRPAAEHFVWHQKMTFLKCP